MESACLDGLQISNLNDTNAQLKDLDMCENRQTHVGNSLLFWSATE